MAQSIATELECPGNTLAAGIQFVTAEQGRTQMNEPILFPTIEGNLWILVSAEERAAAYPDTFHLPPLAVRQSLSLGDAAKLLFEIETRENGLTIERGVDRMWVIVRAKTAYGYIGVLDNDPGIAENLWLREGDPVAFAPEHVADIGRPPRDYIIEKYGASFFKT
jgi:hypothetical protein